MKESINYFIPTELSHSTLVELLPVFFDEVGTDLLAMKEAVKEGNIEESSKLAHKLKGTSLSYGACLISESLNNYEDHFKSQEEIESFLTTLSRAIRDTQKYAYSNYNLQ